MAFRRRKPAVTWLPHIDFHQSKDYGVIQSVLSVDQNFGIVRTAIHALVMDQPEEANRANVPSLADFDGSAYRLRRIVGKFFATMDNNQPGAPDTQPIAALVTAGFIVLRVDSATGAPLLAATANNYTPIGLDNTSDPWIWRRSWVLNHDFSGHAAALQNQFQFPRTNADYGSVQDGPHIDQKTARRVSKEERLFFVVSTANMGANSTLVGLIPFLLDYRILASPLRVAGNRRNASR